MVTIHYFFYSHKHHAHIDTHATAMMFSNTLGLRFVSPRTSRLSITKMVRHSVVTIASFVRRAHHKMHEEFADLCIENTILSVTRMVYRCKADRQVANWTIKWNGYTRLKRTSRYVYLFFRVTYVLRRWKLFWTVIELWSCAIFSLKSERIKANPTVRGYCCLILLDHMISSPTYVNYRNEVSNERRSGNVKNCKRIFHYYKVITLLLNCILSSKLNEILNGNKNCYKI